MSINKPLTDNPFPVFPWNDGAEATMKGEMEFALHRDRKREEKQEALRYNNGKLRYSLTSPLAIEGLVKVLEYGAQKYEPHNWKKGFRYTSIIDSTMRHIEKLRAGELIDPESGLPHIDHIGCNWMFLSHYMKTNTGTNDLQL